MSCIISGWYVTYIDRDPETLAAQERKAKKQKMDKDDEERLMDFIDKQIERAKGQDIKEEEDETFKIPLMRSESDAPLVLDIKLKPKPKLLPVLEIKQEKIKDEDSKNWFNKLVSNKSIDEKNEKLKRSNETESVKKLKSDDNSSIEGWLREGLMVKVTTKSLGDKYYKAKGVVQSVSSDGFVGKVKLKTPEEVDGHVIRLDQEYLETVIPAIGKKILILWGKHKGTRAIVKKLHIEHYSVDVELEKDKMMKKLPYEQVCKYID